ncbi:unnamed protein product [Rotaria sordida]|uniref:Uncharacterized protein n=1 Tax=Rotaria sordida TaxID=392033 RepID=A0A819Y691_9BILA|nr:unnamed protein product [Rotaria sordida]CAF4154475.1 unnamed protein product [Rotaria sordida]
MGCSIEEALHPDFRKIDLKLASTTPEKLNIYLRNEFNWLWQALRYRLGLMTEHDLNRLESALSQDILHRMEHIIGVKLSSNADRDPKQSISIHVDLTPSGSEATRTENRLMKKTVGIESVPLDDNEKRFFFGEQQKNIVQATRYPNDGSLLLEAQCIAEKILTSRGGLCLKQHISHILFAQDTNLPNTSRLAGVVTENGKFAYASHLHLSPGYKAKFRFGEAKNSTFYRNLINKLKNQYNISPPVPEHRLTVATDEGGHEFLCGSHDQIILIWTYDQNKNSVQSLITCKGHQGTIETLAAQKTLFCSGSFDKTIKLWGLDDEGEDKSSTKECRLTINAHNENISSIAWMSSNELVSAP